MTNKVKYFSNGMEGQPFKTNPRLVRAGIASDDYGEMTPVIFRGKRSGRISKLCFRLKSRT